MANSSERNFPQYLSKKFTAIWMESDELVIAFVLTGFCLVGKSWLCWIASGLIQVMYIKTKRKQTKGFFKHILYLAGFITLKGYPEYFEQEFHE